MFRYRILLSILLIIAFGRLTTSTRAQHLQASLSHYSADDNGLSSDAVADIRQDDYGYLWIATWNGLSRFDGYHFYNYKTGNVSGIPHLHNRIHGLTIDPEQNIWLRMYDGRVFVLNRHADRLMNPFEGIEGSDEFRTTVPLLRMSSGDILAAFSGVGIYRMRLVDGRPRLQLISASGLKVNSMAEGYHDDIWVGTDRGLHRVDLVNRMVERKGQSTDETINILYSVGYNIYAGCESGRIFCYGYGQEPRLLRANTAYGGISNLFVDSRGTVWFADSRLGTNRLKDGNEKHFEQRVPAPEYDSYGGSYAESDSIVWVRMNHGGYGYYNRAADEVEYFHNDPSNPWNLSNTVNASLELPEGVVFMSTSRRGLEKLEILKNNIVRTQLVPNPSSNTENEIRGMFYDHKHKLLLMGNKNSTLFITPPNGSRYTITKDSNGNPIGRIYGIAQDSKGNYWLCSKDHGLFKMTPAAGGGFTLQNYCHSTDKHSLSSDAAYQSVEDADGNIWVATYGGGVNVLTRQQHGRHLFLHPDNGMDNYPRHAFRKVRTIALAKDGKVWAGTTDGILIMSLKNGKVDIERVENSVLEPTKILMSNDIVTMATDSQGRMWIGTNGGGLCLVTGRDADGRWLFESYGVRDGLPSEEIKSITFDHTDNVWFSTDHVICSFNPAKKIFTTFSSLDGVDETTCSEGAAITLDNGNILFGTLNGYYTIDRRRLETTSGSVLKLRITDFLLDNQIVSPRLNDYYDYYVPDAKQVTLPSNDAVFAFRFAAMNYQLQHRMIYQYMLEGYDTDWHNADKSRTATYSNVPSGKYVFKVKAFLIESPDHFNMRSIEVIVPPHSLLSGRVVWLYMVLAVLLSPAVMFWRQHQLRLKDAD